MQYRINKNAGLTVIILLVQSLMFATAQVDYTSKISNPSFETGNLTGWTWSGATGYAWLGPNTDGDATKQGSYICGIWNAGIGDAECAQTISGIPNGYYKITALATVSNNRLTNQRLFANSVSQLYGDATNPNYSTANIAILGTSFGETNITFAGNSLSSAENGPFKKMSVITQVINGSVKIGFRVSGRNNTKGFIFSSVSSKSDEGFFKFDNFTLTEVSKVATLDGISLSFGSLDTTFVSGKTLYTATLPAGVKTVKPLALPTVQGVTITGDESVDVSSGTGSSTIIVTSLDGTSSKTYTITYKVLSQSYRKVNDGIELTVPNGSMKIKVCTDKIIQVSYSNTPSIPAKDTVVVNRIWNATPEFSVTDNADTITLSTQTLNIKVSKTSFIVKYYDLAGKLILAEASKSIKPVTVLTTNTNNCVASFFSPADEGLYGLGQHQQKIMNYKGYTEVLDQQNKEIALPFLLSTRGFGLLWDNYSYTNFYGNADANTQFQFNSEGGKMLDYYFMYGPKPDSIIHLYRVATGKAPMFPKWAFGLFQSKDKYSSSTELLTMVNKYREAGFPLDCIVQDWDYWTPDYWGSHTMNSTRYPDPKALVDSLHMRNVHTMISIWPVFHSSTTNYQAFNTIGAMYPSNGSHHFYDPHNNQAKTIYWNQVNSQLFAKYGWDAWWADNDEPQGYPDGFDRKNFITAKGSGVNYYNTYPIEHTAGFYAGWRKDHSDKRVFTLSRSAFSGQQRYATATWSGDISSNWNDFQLQLSAGLNFCMSGMPYWTTDIGGYVYVDWSTANNNELMTRWFQYGAFCPVFRIHGQGDKSMVSTNTLTANTISNMAKTDKLRYRLMPYIYTLAGKVTHENYTMMRHLVMDYPADLNVRNIDNQFMFGSAIMVNPVTSAGVNKRSVYLPAGKWIDFWTGQSLDGAKTITADAPLDKIPLFVKAGSILPMGPHLNFATESVDPTEIRVFKGANGNFELYEDDGKSYNYEKGAYSLIPFTYDDAAGTLTIGNRKGTFDGMMQNRTFKVVLVDSYYGVGLESPAKFDSIVNYNGNEAIVKFKTDRIVPVSHFEAEEATLSGGAVKTASYTGFSGTGYVAGMNLSKKSSVTFSVNAIQSGLYQLSLRYSAGSGSIRRNLQVDINQNQHCVLNPVATRDWNTWNTESITIHLDKDINTVQLWADSAFISLDYIDINAVAKETYQTELKICRIKKPDNSGYMTVQDNKILLLPKDTTLRTQLWKIERTQAGTYKIGLVNRNSFMTSVDEISTELRTNAYTGLNSQLWRIEKSGDKTFSINSQNDKLLTSSVKNDSVVLLANLNSINQFWIFEDTTVVKYQSIYEPFDYPVGTKLDGLGAVGNGWGGSWNVLEGQSTDMSISNPDIYTGLATKGNKLSASPGLNSALRAYRELHPKWEDDGQNIWISFLLSVNNPTSLVNSWQGISLYNGTSERVFIGKNWAKSYLGIVGYDATEGISTVSALGFQPTWIVLKIKTSGDSNTEIVNMWINPNPNSEPSVSTANVSSTVQLNNGFDRIVCHLGNTSGIVANYDEIRIGRNFQLVSGNINTGISSVSSNHGFNYLYNRDNQQIAIKIASQNNGVINMKIMDLSGRVLEQKTDKLITGMNTLQLNINKNTIEKGIYILNLKYSNESHSEKIILY